MADDTLKRGGCANADLDPLANSLYGRRYLEKRSAIEAGQRDGRRGGKGYEGSCSGLGLAIGEDPVV